MKQYYILLIVLLVNLPSLAKDKNKKRNPTNDFSQCSTESDQRIINIIEDELVANSDESSFLEEVKDATSLNPLAQAQLSGGCGDKYTTAIDKIDEIQNELLQIITQNGLRTPAGKKEYSAKLAELKSAIAEQSNLKEAKKLTKIYSRLSKKLDDIDFSIYSEAELKYQRQLVNFYTNKEKKSTYITALGQAAQIWKQLDKAEQTKERFEIELNKKLGKDISSNLKKFNTYVVMPASQSSGREISSSSPGGELMGTHVLMYGSLSFYEYSTGHKIFNINTIGPGLAVLGKSPSIFICTGKLPHEVDGSKNPYAMGLTAGGAALFGGFTGFYFGKGGACMLLSGGVGWNFGGFAGVSVISHSR